MFSFLLFYYYLSILDVMISDVNKAWRHKAKAKAKAKAWSFKAKAKAKASIFWPQAKAKAKAKAKQPKNSEPISANCEMWI